MITFALFGYNRYVPFHILASNTLIRPLQGKKGISGRLSSMMIRAFSSIAISVHTLEGLKYSREQYFKHPAAAAD